MSRVKSNPSVRRLHMSNIQSSRTVKMYQLRLRLTSLIIQIKDKESKEKIKTINKLAEITSRRWWIPLDVNYILHKKIYMIEYRIFKKNCGTLRATYLEERSRSTAKVGNKQEETRIHALLTTEKSI